MFIGTVIHFYNVQYTNVARYIGGEPQMNSVLNNSVKTEIPVTLKLSHIFPSIGPKICSSSLCFIVDEFPLISVAKDPRQSPLSVLLIVKPVSLIGFEELRIVLRKVEDSEAVGLSVFPLAEVLVAVGGGVRAGALNQDKSGFRNN